MLARSGRACSHASQENKCVGIVHSALFTRPLALWRLAHAAKTTGRATSRRVEILADVANVAAQFGAGSEHGLQSTPSRGLRFHGQLYCATAALGAPPPDSTCEHCLHSLQHPFHLSRQTKSHSTREALCNSCGKQANRHLLRVDRQRLRPRQAGQLLHA